MSLGLGGLTAGIVEYALDGLSLRHTAIASNIANANSTGYRPLRVSFEHHLVAMSAQSGTGGMATADVAGLPRPEVSLGLPADSSLRRNGVETDIVQLNQNVLQYQALIKGLDKYMGSVATAINEGRR